MCPSAWHESGGGSTASGVRVIQAVVVDDQALMRTGLQHILDAADDFEIVAAARSAHLMCDVVLTHWDSVSCVVRVARCGLR